MKKLILLLAAVALATSVWAQDTPKKPSFAGFVSNGFWDNWEITLGGGAGTALSNGTNQGSFGDRINFEANFGLTKWFHPVTGMRLQLQGGRFANFDDVLGKAKWPYLFVHADFMLNFSNWAGGYREDRAYYAVPFAGFGYAPVVRVHFGLAQQVPHFAVVRFQYRTQRADSAFAGQPRCDGRLLPVRLQRYGRFHLPL